jgi:hypothetical protein
MRQWSQACLINRKLQSEINRNNTKNDQLGKSNATGDLNNYKEKQQAQSVKLKQYKNGNSDVGIFCIGKQAHQTRHDVCAG